MPGEKPRERWVRWLGNKPKPPSIYEEVTTLMATRQVWEGFDFVYQQAPPNARSNNTFQTWLIQNYFRTQASAIRRQAEVSPKVISVARLLKDIARQPGGVPIDRTIPEDDLARLAKETKPIRDFVNNNIAHYNKKRGVFALPEITWGDLNRSIDLVVDLFAKYAGLIHDVHIVRHITMSPWPTIFVGEPWVASRDEFVRLHGEIIRREQLRDAR